MKLLGNFLILVLFALLLSLSGCCCGGSDDKTTVIEKQPVTTTPLGEELVKLKEAHEKGALTDQEYEEQKAKLLKGQ